MTSLELTEQQAALGWRPLAGRILLRLHRHSEMQGSLVIPEVARDHTVNDALVEATVLAVGYGPFLDGTERLPGVTEDDIKAGDRVAVMTLAKDLNKAVLMTCVTRVIAVLG